MGLCFFVSVQAVHGRRNIGYGLNMTLVQADDTLEPLQSLLVTFEPIVQTTSQQHTVNPFPVTVFT
jgi:hypothetical protein